MRIIDKNTDFYDFYQNVYKDDTFTFDRRDSYILTKDALCKKLKVDRHYDWRMKKFVYDKFKFLLLQVCNNFWLFLVEIVSINDWDYTTDYKIELLNSWRDFDKPRELCKLEIIEPRFFRRRATKEEIYENINNFKIDIHINNYRVKKDLNNSIVYVGSEKVEKHIPILKACGVANLMDAHEIYLAFEEYFSLEKSDSERRDPIGTTDIDKVESHGFDKKISFRGK